MTVTLQQLETRIQNNIRRWTPSLATEIPNIINDAQDQICQLRNFWFLKLNQTYTVTVGVGSWWVLTLPAGASYNTLPDDVTAVFETVNTGTQTQNLPLEYLPYDTALTLYPVPTALAASGEVTAYSETLDYTGIILWPVPIANTTIFVEWRAKSLPDLVNATDHNVLTDSYTNVIQKWSEALCWQHLGESSKFQNAYGWANNLAKTTVCRENTRKRWARIHMLPQRKGTEIARTAQIPPFGAVPPYF